jgi:hypothetical protein
MPRCSQQTQQSSRIPPNRSKLKQKFINKRRLFKSKQKKPRNRQFLTNENVAQTSQKVHEQRPDYFALRMSYLPSTNSFPNDVDMRQPQESVGPDILNLFGLYSIFNTPRKIFYDNCNGNDDAVTPNETVNLTDEDDDKLIINFDHIDENETKFLD